MKKFQTPQSIDMTDFLEGVLKATPQESVIFIEKSLALINHIFNILEKKEIKQKDLATLLGKSEAEISKWLCGSHNFTLRTISKIESVLGEIIIDIPKKTREEFIYDKISQSKIIKIIPTKVVKDDDFKKITMNYDGINNNYYKNAS